MEWGEIGTLNGISAGIEETQMLRVEVHWYVIPMYHAVVSLLDLFLLQSKQLHMVGRHPRRKRPGNGSTDGPIVWLPQATV